MYVPLDRTVILDAACECSSQYKKEVTCVTIDGILKYFI